MTFENSKTHLNVFYIEKEKRGYTFITKREFEPERCVSLPKLDIHKKKQEIKAVKNDRETYFVMLTKTI